MPSSSIALLCLVLLCPLAPAGCATLGDFPDTSPGIAAKAKLAAEFATCAEQAVVHYREAEAAAAEPQPSTTPAPAAAPVSAPSPDAGAPQQ